MRSVLKRGISERIYWLIYIETPFQSLQLNRIHNHKFMDLVMDSAAVTHRFCKIICIFYVVVVSDLQG